MRVVTVVGARPQFIKAAPLSALLRETHSEYLVHTGQHYDAAMSDVFFEELDIAAPDLNLNVGSGSHADQTARMLLPLENAMRDIQPDWVLVYGDTNSTLAAALAAAKLNLPIAHVEAGLRSYNRAMPEEINRVLTDHVSRLLFAPTPTAVVNLTREGITAGVVMTGDIMLDAVQRNLQRARATSTLHTRLNLTQPYAVVTIHRPANTDDPQVLADIMKALNALKLSVIFPVHPRTRHALQTCGVVALGHIHLTEPVGALDMLVLLDQAAVVLTDSGGLQKEAYMLQTPCVTVRTETEWVETIEAGWNRLCDTQPDAVLYAVEQALLSRPTAHPDLYGDGHAARRMVTAMESL